MHAQRSPSLAAGLAAFAMALFGVAATGAAQTQAQGFEPPSIMVVFDASGSMWGNIEGSKAQKFVIARDALGKALQSVPAQARLGLISTGQKRRGDCGDVDALTPLGPLARDKVMGPLDKLNPKGKGPIVLGMREAAKALGASANASIIVIHDDLDNCQQDACAAAAEIQAAQPRIAIHTLSLGMASEDAARMSCVAKATGGRRFEARNAAEVGTMIEDALKLASVDAGRRQTAPAVQAKPAPEPVAKVRPAPAAVPAQLEGKAGLRLSASLGPKTEAITVPIAWRVMRDGAPASEQPVLETTAPQASIDAPPGTYVVEAKIGLVSTKQKFEVTKERPTRAHLVLNAGAAWLLARTHKGGPLLEGTVYTVSEMSRGDARSKEPARLLWMSRETEPLVHLPAGTYRIGVQHGTISQDRAVVIEPGVSGELDVVLGAGRLQLKAVNREGGEPVDNVVFIVAEDDPDAPQGRRELLRSAAPAPEFVLAAGTYYVVARQGANEVRERIAIGAGDTIARAIPMGLARVALAVKVDGAAAPLKEPIAYRVLRTDGEQREVGRYGAATQRLDLPAGRYRIEAQVGAQNVRAVRDLELAAGRTTQVAFDLQTARLILRPADGHASADIVWEIRDAGGRSVARSTTPETRAVLAPGKYTVRGEFKGRRFERVIDLKAGERRTLEGQAE